MSLYLLVIFILALTPWQSRSENLLANQPGTSIPANTWTKISGASGVNPAFAVGYDKYDYVPALHAMCGLMSGYRGSTSTEPNRSYLCYSYRENRWFVVDTNSTFHDDMQPDGGHTVGAMSIDPTTATLYGFCCLTGAQASEAARHTWIYDFIAQVGRDTHPGAGTPLSPTGAKPYINITLPAGAFDARNHTLVTFAGASSQDVGFLELNVLTGVWSFNAGTGTIPSLASATASMAQNTLDGKLYLFGGSLGGVGGTGQNAVYTYDSNTHVSALVSANCAAGPSCPTPRQGAGWAFSSAENKFFLHGGLTGAGAIVTDLDWIFDPVALTWTQVTPLALISPAAPAAPYMRMVYFPDEDVFVSPEGGTNNYNATLWAYRISSGGPKAGYMNSQTTYSQSAGLNRNIDGSPTSATAGEIADGGLLLYQIWPESGGPSDTGECFNMKAYAQTTSTAGVVVQLPNPSACNSMATDLSGAPVDVGDPSITLVGLVPWASWHEQNIAGLGNPEQIWARAFVSNAWTGTGGAIGRSGGAAAITQGQSRIINVNGSPTIGYREVLRDTLPWHSYFYVKQWDGSSWPATPLGAAPLNRDGDGTHITYADSVDIVAGSGSNFYAAWTEYTTATAGAPPRMLDSAPQAYLSLWNGSSWSIPCSGSANITATDSAYSIRAIYMAGRIFVSFQERAALVTPSTHLARTVVRECAGGVWSTISSDLRRDTQTGWAFRPSLATDGSNIYVAQAEQGNTTTWGALTLGSFGSRSCIHVEKWNGSSWSHLGGCLNKDTFYGAANAPSIAVFNGQPVVQWGETKIGNLRQMYAMQWSGTDWMALGSAAPSVSPGPVVLRGVVLQ